MEHLSLLQKNAPQNIQDEYVKYIKYISKYLPSSNIVEIKNKQIIGVAEGVSKGGAIARKNCYETY